MENSHEKIKRCKCKCDTYGCPCSRMDASNIGAVIRTLFYRIWLYRKHNIFLTILQLLIPPLILYGSAQIHEYVLPKHNVVKSWKEWPIISETDLYAQVCGRYCSKTPEFVVGYYPKSPLTDKIMETCKELMKANNVEFESVKDPSEIVELSVLHHLHKMNGYIGGVIFDHKNTTPLKPPPERLKFTIRMANYIPSQIQPFTTFSHERNDPKYYTPFMALELAIGKAYMTELESSFTQETADQKNLNTISIRPFPYLPHDEYQRADGIAEKTEWIVPTGLVLGMTVIVFSFVRGPVSEKETGFKFWLNLMGLPPSAYWIGWILNQLIVQLIVLGIQIYVMFYQDEKGGLVAHGSYDLWCFVLFLYTLASLSFMCFVSAFFKRSVMATYVGATIWLLTYYFIDVYVPSYVISISHTAKVAICLIPNGGLMWAMILLTSLGENWQSLPLSLDENGVTLIEVMIMFVVDIILYFQLTMYVDHLRPGPFEAIQPWNYFFDNIRCTWDNKLKSTNVTPSGDGDALTVPSVEFIQMSKKYHRSNLLAVDTVNLKIFPGSITVLLGHIGCGKTTLIRLLCGEYFATSGTAKVNGYDIRYYRQKVQKAMSVGFQRNLFCDYITVMEHLLVIGMLKGLSRTQAKENAKKLLVMFELMGIKDSYIYRLLHHEKRLLTIVLAFIGNTSVILLDEPTVGLEPELKRFVWDRFKALCTEDKTLVIFTSDMEEAYYLGSRIAIMSKGHVVGCGTVDRLEKRFATGYHLKLRLELGTDESVVKDFVKDCIETSTTIENQTKRISRAVNLADPDDSVSMEGLSDDEDDGAKPKSMTTITSQISILKSEGAFRVDVNPKASLQADVKDHETLLLLLPKRESVYFHKLFTSLENESVKTRLGIRSYRIKLYTLEQAFKEVDEYMELQEESETLMETLSDLNPVVNSFHSSMPSLENTQIAYGCFLALQRLRALMLKRCLWIKGGLLYLLVQVFAPLFLLIFTIQATNEYYNSTNEPSTLHYNVREMFPHAVALIRHQDPKDISEFQKRYVLDIERVAKVREGINRTFQLELSRDQARLETSMFSRYVIGADFTDKANPIAMFSSVAFHAGPVSLMVMINAMLKYKFSSERYSIDVSSNPIPHSDEVLLKFFPKKAERIELESSMTFAIIIGFGFFIFTSGFVSQPTFERLSHMKRLQLNTSVNAVTYWLSMFIVDFTLSIVLGLVMVIILWYLPPHRTFEDINFAMCFIYLWALSSYCCILMSYICSFFFRRATTSFYGMLSCNQVLGLFTFVLVKTFAKSTPQRIAKFTLHLLLPFNIPSGLYSLVNLAVRNAQCKLMSEIVLRTICEKSLDPKFTRMKLNIDRSCCKSRCHKEGNCREIQPYLDFSEFRSSNDAVENLTTEFLFLFFHAITLTILLYLTEKGVTQRFLRKSSDVKRPRRGLKKAVNEEVSESVKHECEIVDGALRLERNIQAKYFIVKGITKQSRNRQVLTDINFFAEPGKLCCIVGPSGAGKSVLFDVFAKVRKSTEGNAYFGKACLVSWHHVNFVSEIGYCPSKDFGLIRMSGIQVLKLFARLKGIRGSQTNEHVNFWIKKLGLQNELSGRCEFYSESVKTRLALACCFIGDPPVIILDDPLKYLDPASLLQFWDIIEHQLAFNRIVIILTTNVESIIRRCNKLIFMVNGHLRYVKKPDAMVQELNIGTSATLVVRLKSDPDAPISFELYGKLKNRIESDLPDATLQEEKHDSLYYQVSNTENKWSLLFGLVEAIKLDFVTIIKDYEIRETVLEDVYRTYALNQHKYRTSPTTLDEFCLTYC